LQGDSDALDELLALYKDRVRRIVSIRFAGRLARLLDEGLSSEGAREALLGLREEDLASDASWIGLLVKLVDRELALSAGATLGEAREERRTLRFEDDLDSGKARREDLERVVDTCVAELQPRECREVILLRDYCGADWDLVRSRLGLLSVEAAQDLYRRAHERLARRMRPNIRR
jgi:hypothetical protein